MCRAWPYVCLSWIHLVTVVTVTAVTGQHAIELRIPIGLFVDTSSRQLNTSFRYGVMVHNQALKSFTYRMDWFGSYIDITDSYSYSSALCNSLARGIFLWVGETHFESFGTVQAHSDTFRMPLLTPSYPMLVTSRPTQHFQIYLRPEFSMALYDLVIRYRWNSVFYLYDSNEGLMNLQRLYNRIGPSKNVNVTARFVQVGDKESTAAMLKRLDRDKHLILKRFVIDMHTQNTTQTLMDILADIGMTTRNYHYLLTNYASEELQLAKFIHHGANVTGFAILNKNSSGLKNFYDAGWTILNTKQWPEAGSEPFKFDAALMFDTVKVIAAAYSQLLTDDERMFRNNFRRNEVFNKGMRGISDCKRDDVLPWERGTAILRYLKKTVVPDGLTGYIAFDETGVRVNFTILIWEITDNGKEDNHERVKEFVGKWSEPDGFVPTSPNYQVGSQRITRTIRVTSIMEEPYLSAKKSDDGKIIPGEYEGYCQDLADMLFRELKEFNYTLNLVKDKNYGKATEHGRWNGMIGELIDKEADMAIAPLTITSERERVVDFSKPFMNLGISIMIKKPEKQKPGVFSFMNPLSYLIWIFIITSLIVVSVVLYLVSRFSPYEWREEYIGTQAIPVNDFNLSNSLWFSLGAFMQQGCDISPRSLSGRIVGSVWWFFTLIMISSYTANLAAFLTVERMLAPINDAESLAGQSEIAYGTMKDGSTMEFFRSSNLAIYQNMWNFMKGKPDVFVKGNAEGIAKVRNSKGKYAFLLESTTNEYTNNRKPCNTMKVGNNLDSKGYGIATPLNSPLRERITLAVLKLREGGDLQTLENKWWYDKGECGGGESKDASQNKLTLSNVAGIFYILIGGLVLSMLTALLEFFYRSRVESRQNKQTLSNALRQKMQFSIQGNPDNENGRITTTYYGSPSQAVGIDGMSDHMTYSGYTHTQV